MRHVHARRLYIGTDSERVSLAPCDGTLFLTTDLETLYIWFDSLWRLLTFVHNPAVMDSDGNVTEYTTISAAIAAAEDGDIVLIPPGQYNESLSIGKAIRLVSFGSRGNPIIPGTGNWAVEIQGNVSVDYAYHTVHFEGLMIRSNLTVAANTKAVLTGCHIYGDVSGSGVPYFDHTYVYGIVYNDQAYVLAGVVPTFVGTTLSPLGRVGWAANADWAGEAADSDKVDGAHAGTGPGDVLLLDASGHAIPETDDGQDLGNSAKRWRNLDLSGSLLVSNLRIEDLDLDFTGTDWDTKAKCNAIGLRFSDYDMPFPTTLRWAVSGTWTHSAGNGWQPSSSTDNEGPALLLPLIRGGNWEAELIIGYTATAAQGRIEIGYVSVSNHIGAHGGLRDSFTNDIGVKALLSTNDGDDTFTVQYSGTKLTGSGDRTLKFRCLNGCIGVWDPYDSSWHYYTGRQSAGASFSADYLMIQAVKIAGQTFWTIYVKHLKLSYLT